MEKKSSNPRGAGTLDEEEEINEQNGSRREQKLNRLLIDATNCGLSNQILIPSLRNLLALYYTGSTNGDLHG